MPMQWKDLGDARLIVAIASTHKLDYPAIAAALGKECTIRAVQERVKTHRRDVRRVEIEEESESKDTKSDLKKNTKGTPKKK